MVKKINFPMKIQKMGLVKSYRVLNYKIMLKKSNIVYAVKVKHGNSEILRFLYDGIEMIDDDI